MPATNPLGTDTLSAGGHSQLHRDSEDHVTAADPHTGYQLKTEKAAASGYASLDANTTLPIAQLPRMALNNCRMFDDMLYGHNNPITVSATTLGMLQVNMTGTAAQLTLGGLAGTPNHPGIVGLSTGTTTSGRVDIQTTTTGISLGGGRARWGVWVHIPTLSVVAQRFEVLCGFADNFGFAAVVDGCFIHYRDDINAGKWEAITSSNSVTSGTVTDTGITVTAATWYRLEAEVNAAGTSVTYYVDGASVATHSTNIPTGVGRELGFFIVILKSLGTTAEVLNLDAYYLELDFTTPR